jgi:hypothetical protein
LIEVQVEEKDDEEEVVIVVMVVFRGLRCQEEGQELQAAATFSAPEL